MLGSSHYFCMLHGVRHYIKSERGFLFWTQHWLCVLDTTVVFFKQEFGVLYCVICTFLTVMHLWGVFFRPFKILILVWILVLVLIPLLDLVLFNWHCICLPQFYCCVLNITAAFFNHEFGVLYFVICTLHTEIQRYFLVSLFLILLCILVLA